jgi:methyl-accepting chemotaxis protein
LEIYKFLESSELYADAYILMIRIILIIIPLLVLAIFLSYREAAAISTPIRIIHDYLLHAVEGDFTKDRIPDKYTKKNDELGDMSVMFNQFVEHIKGIIEDVRHSSSSLADSSGKISTNLKDFSSNIQVQSANSEEISASIEQIESTMTTVSNRVKTRTIQCQI